MCSRRRLLFIDPSLRETTISIVDSPAYVISHELTFNVVSGVASRLFVTMALNEGVHSTDYYLFSNLLGTSPMNVAPYKLGVKRGILKVLWVLDDNPGEAQKTFMLSGVAHTWRGPGYIALYDGGRSPVDVSEALCSKVGSTIQWNVQRGTPSSSMSSSTFELTVEPSAGSVHLACADLLRRCVICGPCERTQFCSACRSVRYCSTKCQKAHWKAGHREQCARERA